MESCDDDMDSKEMQESRDDDSCHADSGLLSMLAEVASATLHNDSLARKTRGNARGRPRKQTAEGRLDPDQPEPTDTNKLSLGQLELLTEKQLVDLFSLMDSDEIRRTFSYSCHLLQRCQFTSSSFGSEMKARQEMQKHLSEHVRDLMRKARDSAGFRFTATPVAPSKAKKISAVVKEVSPVRKPVNNVKEKGTVKIKLQSPRANSKGSPSSTKVGRAPVVKKNQQQSPRKSAIIPKEDPVVIVKTPPKRKRRSAVAVEAAGDDPAMAGLELVPEEITVKDKWMKLYHDKYRAVDEARFRERTDLSADNSEADQDFGTVAEEVVVTSEETFASASVSLPPMIDAPSLPDHDYNIYRVNRKAKAAAKAAAEAVGLDVQGRRNLDEQMEAVAQSVAAAAQEKEKLKRKRGGNIQNQQQGMGVPLHSFMLEETTKQSKVVVKNKPTEPLPCVGSEVVVGYNPSEFYLMKSSELPVIEDLRQQKTTVGASGTVVIDGQPQFTFVCMNDDGELIEESAIEDSAMFLEEDEEQLLEQVAAQATGRSRSLGDVPDKEMVDIARKRAKVKPKFVSQSAGERELALQYIGELKQQRGSGADSLHCKICTPVRTFTAPTTLLSHYRSHAGIKPYECRRCGAVFTRQHSLNYHMLIHANLSRFTCPDCHRQFRHPSHYKEHRRRHTGEAPYECSDCMQRFRTRNSYKRHLMTRHGKLLTSTGGLIILPEEEFNKVRCKPRPVRATGGGARNNIDVSGLANDDETEFVVPDAIVASTSSNMTAKKSTPKKAVPKRGAKKAAAAAKVKTEEEDGSGNFEQQRQEDLIRLLYQRLTSADGGEEEESGVESGSPIPADGVVESMEIQDENGEIQVMEVNCIEETVVVESQDDVAAAVVVESIPNSVEQVVEEQCEVVAEENWGNYVHLTVDGQNNVIFLDDGQVVGATAEETTTVMIEEAPKPAVRASRRTPAKTKAVTRRSAAAAAKEVSATPSQGSSSTATTTNSGGEVDLLSFVQSAGVMVQHILDIQSENS